MAEYKLDIWQLLGNLSTAKGDIYAGLTDEERKGFAPLVVMRWLSGCDDQLQLVMLNEVVNPHVFALGKHPHLLMLLLQVATTKRAKRYQWIPIKGKKKNVETLRVIQEYFNMSSREVKLLNPLPPAEEVVGMAEALGYDKDALTKLRKELQHANA